MEQKPVEDTSSPHSPERRETLEIKVLLADDEEGVLALSQRILQRMNCKIEVVKDGQALLDKLSDESNQYDIVISDNTMPKMKGIEVLRKIREDARFKNLPFIINSGGETHTGLPEEARALGAEFLEKPFTPADFAALVRKTYFESKK